MIVPCGRVRSGAVEVSMVAVPARVPGAEREMRGTQFEIALWMEGQIKTMIYVEDDVMKATQYFYQLADVLSRCWFFENSARRFIKVRNKASEFKALIEDC